MITGLFTAPETWPFGVAFALIVGIALVEGLGMLISLSPSNWLDDLLPDVHGDSGLDRVLGWLHLGKVPSLVLLVLFLTGCRSGPGHGHGAQPGRAHRPHHSARRDIGRE